LGIYVVSTAARFARQSATAAVCAAPAAGPAV